MTCWRRISANDFQTHVFYSRGAPPRRGGTGDSALGSAVERESLSEVPGKTRAFLTKVKCPVIARDIGHPVGSSVIQIVHSNQK
jgi:hypothetical protein